jgi:SAM-dependent methyltransferase
MISRVRDLLRKINFSGKKRFFMHHGKIRKYRSSKKLTLNNSVYELLGVDDVDEFYADRFAWGYGPNIVEHDPFSRFDITYIKQYWIYDNIAEGSRVLDVGCGSGTLNLLKSKGVYLAGVDLSEKALEQALLAGYDEAVLCDSFDIPFADKSFDYIVSLDVLGHIENEVKDVYLNEWKRLLKDSGVMLHGTEADDVDYYSLSEKEKEHILLDGHVGLESFDKVEKRFQKHFKDVHVENCVGPCYNWHDIKKYEKTEDRVGRELRSYLSTFGAEQVKAFNVAMLLMRNLLLKDNLLGKSGGFMFVKASGKQQIKKGSFFSWA